MTTITAPADCWAIHSVDLDDHRHAIAADLVLGVEPAGTVVRVLTRAGWITSPDYIATRDLTVRRLRALRRDGHTLGLSARTLIESAPVQQR